MVWLHPVLSERLQSHVPGKAVTHQGAWEGAGIWEWGLWKVGEEERPF